MTCSTHNSLGIVSVLNPLYEVTYRTQTDPGLQGPVVIVIDEIGI